MKKSDEAPAEAGETGVPEADLDGIRAGMIEAALPNVAFDGWSEALLRRAAADSGVGMDMARIAFPGGAADLAAAFHEAGDREMLARFEARNGASMRIRERITTAVRLRIEAIGPHEDAVRRATAFYALPGNAVRGSRLMWATADMIWNAVGDTSEDYNWYTKRLTLSGVISSTLLYWMEDSSPDKEATWRFLDRRIEDVMRIEKIKGALRRNPLGRGMLAVPEALLSRVRPPSRAAMAGRLPVGFPGRSRV